MSTKTDRDISYYQSLPYTIVLRKDDEGDFVAEIQELSGCMAHGETEAIAIDRLRSFQSLWIEDALESGDPIPEPESQEQLPSGKWMQRVPRTLHRDLVMLAKRESVSLNQLVTSMLAGALAQRSCAHAIESFLATSSPASQARSSDWVWQIDDPEPLGHWVPSRLRREGGITASLERVKRIKGNDKGMILLNKADEHQEAHV